MNCPHCKKNITLTLDEEKLILFLNKWYGKPGIAQGVKFDKMIRKHVSGISKLLIVSELLKKEGV